MIIYREVYYMALSAAGALFFISTLVKYIKDKGDEREIDPIEQALVLLSAFCVICFALSLVALGDVFPTISSAQKPAMARGGRV